MIESEKTRILVVEDNISWQEIYNEILTTQEQNDVVSADSYDDAIKQLDSQDFDIVIVDIGLPKSSGGTEDFEYGFALLGYIAKLKPRPQVMISTGHSTIPVDLNREIEGFGGHIEVIHKEQIIITEKVNALLASIQRLSLDKGLEEDLWKASGKLSGVIDTLNGSLRVLLERTKELTGAKVGHILFSTGDSLRIYAGTGEEPKGYRVPIDRSVTGKVFQTGLVMNVPKTTEEPLYYPLIKDGINSELAIPLIDSGRTIGVLNLESSQVNGFDGVKENIARMVADLIVVTLRNEQRKQELAINSRLLNEVLNSSEVQRYILEIGAKQLNASVGGLLLLDRDDLLVQMTYPENLLNEIANKRLRINDCICGIAVSEKRVVNVKNVQEEKRYCDLYKVLGKNMRSEIVAPMIISGKVIGALNFESTEIEMFTEYDESLLSDLAKQAAIALEINRLYKELEITNQNLKEARNKEKLAEVGELAGDIVHRINTPLSLIRANVQLIQLRCKQVVEDSEYLSGKLVEIHRIADEALDMVQEMKDKARKGLLEPVDIKAIITTALTEVAIPANISVEDVTDTYVNLPPVRANLTLTKVFRNLIANAVDAMPNGGKITLGVKEVDNQWIEAFVEDNGVGIPEDWREEIFDILSVFSKKRPEQRGHGLGLWYSRAYVEACGGQFPPPESMVREGTRFTIRLQVWKP